MDRVRYIGVAAAIALAPLCIPPAQAHADDPCSGITDPAIHQGCVDGLRLRRFQGDCQASPLNGQLGQVCLNSWVQTKEVHNVQ